VRLLPNLHVGEQTKHGATPIGASPGVGTIEPLISRLRFALWHVAKQISPHLFGSKLAGLYPRNGFNVNRYAFFDPMVVFRHRGECQMDHLVRQCPVTVELC